MTRPESHSWLVRIGGFARSLHSKMYCVLIIELQTIHSQDLRGSPRGVQSACGSRVLPSSVFGFSALCAEKPNTNKRNVPRFPSGVEGLPKAKTAGCVSPVAKMCMDSLA